MVFTNWYRYQKNKNTVAVFCAVALLAGGVGHTVAETGAPIEDVLVIGTPIPNSALNTAGSIASASDDSLSSAAVTHPATVMNTLPGVWVHQGSGQEYLMSIRSPIFTGAGACGAFWLGEEGIALRSAGFCNVNQLFDAHTEHASQWVALKGPQTSYLGSNAQFGSIHIALPATDSVDNTVRLSGSDRGFRQFQNVWGLQTGQSALASFLTLKEDDGWRDASGYKQQKWTLKHQFKPASLSVDSSFSFTNLEQETAGFVEGANAYQDKTLRQQNANPEAYRDAKAFRWYSRIHKKYASHEWTITPFARSNKMAFLMHFVPWQPTEQNGHDAVGVSLLHRVKVNSTLRTYWGADLEYTEGFLKEYQNNPAPFGQDRFPMGGHYDYQVQAAHAALFAGVRFERRFGVLDLGIRADDDRYDYKTRLPAGSACAVGVMGCRFYRPADRQDDFSNLSGHVNFSKEVVVRKNQFLGFHGRVAKGFRLPQTAELYRAQNATQVDVDSATLNSAELGVTWRGDHLRLAATLYQMRSDNGIFQDTERRYVNGVETSHQGVEYELDYDWQTLPIELSVSGTFARHEYENDPTQLGVAQNILLSGNDIDTAPTQKHQAVIAWQQNEDWRHSVSWQRVGAYYLDPQNTAEYPGHDVASVESRWQASRSWSWQFGVVNLADKLYADRADVSFGTPRYFPAARRTLVAKTEYKF